MEKLVLIDGNSLINRAFYATPMFTTKDGLPTNGVFGFVKLMLKIIADKKPTHFAVAFDLHAPTFRHKLYADYKAGRKPMPDDLRVQFPILKEVLALMGIKIMELEGYEADDLLGTVAKRFKEPTFIYTGDRDAYQLVDDTTHVCYTRKGVSDILELSSENFVDEIGLTPAQIIELKALMGDKSDNIPGVTGIGEKGAMNLLERYSNIDEIYNNLDEIKGALRDKLVNGKDSAYFSKKLATIDTNAPLELSINECVLKMPFKRALRDKFAELEFKSLFSAPIFEEREEEAKEENLGDIIEFYPSSVQEIFDEIASIDVETIACDFSENEFHFVAFTKNQSIQSGGKEYILPIKKDLLDAGFFDWELEIVYKRLFTEKTHVIAYNVKEVAHQLSKINVPFFTSYDDVSILKCIADGLGNSDGLPLCLTQNGIKEKYRAFGLACLREVYLKKLSQEEKKLYNEVELPLVKVLFDMENEGVSIDEQALHQFASKYSAELSTLTHQIYELAGEVFNINSTQQLGKILFEKLRIAGASKKKTGKHKTTAEELEKYADEWEIVRLILRYRKIQKLNSTYIEGFKSLLINGKVHTTYNQANTATGRLSSVNPNIQNIPIRTEEGRELRKLFKASEGNVLIDADYSQIELRLLAHFSKCKELICAYCEGQDIHAITASQVFNVPLEEVTALQRRDAKAVNFGIIYGISAFGLSNDLHISTKKAQEYINKYFETYSDVKEYMQTNVTFTKENGYVKTLFGRRRVINEIRSSNYMVRSFGERASMNMPLQGSSADIIKLAMINVHKQLKEKGFKAKLVLQVHDELVIDSPKEEAQAVAELLQNEMENAVSLTVPLTVEVGVGDSWFETK